MASASTLPDELVCNLASFIHPQSIVDFACVNKRFSRCASTRLKAHAKRSEDFCVIHDRNPLTIPSLIREGLHDDGDLWYIRTLDIWTLRDDFGHWRDLEFPPTQASWEDWDPPVHDHSHVKSSFYSETDLSRFHDRLSNTLRLSDSFRLPVVSNVGFWRKLIALPIQGFTNAVQSSSLLNKWMARLHDGSDEVPKVLLMALSPRLKDVSFICYDTWQGPEFSSSHPMRLLSAILRRLAPLPAQSWPCFQNLKKVTIAQPSELLHPHDAFYVPSRDVAPLLLLPRIEVLQLNLMMGEEDEPDPDYEGPINGAGKAYTFEWESGRSSCKELNFYCCDLAPETVASFIEATSSLRSIRGISKQKRVMESLLACTTDSLESLDGGDGYSKMHETIWEDHLFTRFRKLAHINVVETWLMAGKASLSSRSEEEGSLVEADSPESADYYAFHAALPKSLKTLSIQHREWGRSKHGNPIPTLVGHLMDLVQAKRPGALENLTTICIHSFGPSSSSTDDNEDQCLIEMGLRIQKLQAQCDANGIELHTDPAFPGEQTCEACNIFRGSRSEPITSPMADPCWFTAEDSNTE